MSSLQGLLYSWVIMIITRIGIIARIIKTLFNEDAYLAIVYLP